MPSTWVRRWTGHALSAVTIAVFCAAMVAGLPRLRGDTSIRIATALLPPQMSEDGRGREAEIITAALRAGGVSTPIEFHVLPFTRHWQTFKSDSRFHAVTTVPADLDLDGLRSEPYVRYQNGIIYRRHRFPSGIGEPPFSALFGRRIVAFAGASAILPQIRSISEKALMYMERGDQLSHSVLYVNGVADAVIADELIFAHYTRELLGAAYQGTAEQTVFDPVFCATPYQMVFRDDRMRDNFNSGLNKIRANGELDAIEQKYAGSTGLSRGTRTAGGC